MPDGICMKQKMTANPITWIVYCMGRPAKHLGLAGMRERLKMVGGSFEVESAPGYGTSITAKIPSGNAARVEAPLDGFRRNQT